MQWTDLALPIRNGQKLKIVAATQSSTGFSAPAERAIDGNTNGAWTSQSCSCSQDTVNNYWEGVMSKNYAINRVVLYNRVDDAENRINKAQVYAGDVYCGEVKYRAGQSVFTVHCGGAVASKSCVNVTVLLHKYTFLPVGLCHTAPP
eukprot:sb/3473768/